MWSPRSFRAALAVVVLFILGAGAIMSAKTATINEPSAVSGLPHSYQSWIASEIQTKLPTSSSVPAIVVFYRSDKVRLSSDQQAKIQQAITPLASTASAATPASPAVPLSGVELSKDGRVALITIAISTKPDDNAISNRVTAMRDFLKQSPIDGVSTAVTGAPGFVTDLGHVFDGADTNLLLATVIVVALLLIATYRSPVLWLVPLIVVGLADQIASSLVAHLAPHVGIRLDGASTGIAQVIVFGAGTDYALLLIARYRDQLRHEADRFVAMRTALRKTTESIVASSSTVAIALALLLTASLMGTRALGFAAGVGIIVAALFGLFILPAAIVLFGRGLFWPLIPKLGDETHRDGRIFGRIGAFVAKRPRAIALASVALLLLLASLGIGIKSGLSSTEQFTSKPESVVGQTVLASAFPAGSSDPIVVLTPTNQVDEVSEILRGINGVTAIVPGPQNATWTELDVTTTTEPSSSASFALIKQIRTKLAHLSQVAVGGDSAISLDASTASSRDTRLIAPLILLVVLVVLVLLLRSVVAPLLLLLTVVGTYFAAMGVAWFIFQHVMHFPALNIGTDFFAFLFLVALGVDYNIFLAARANEERATLGNDQGMLMALRSTGGVITSAGILLASVFLVLGVLPLIALTQIGVIVCAGVLLDTLLVRTVLVPALALSLKDRFWWPNRQPKVKA